MATSDGTSQRVAGVWPGLSGHPGADVTGSNVEASICTPDEKGKEPLDPLHCTAAMVSHIDHLGGDG